MNFMSVVVNINVNSNNNSIINSNNHAIQRQDPPPPEKSGDYDSLLDWFWGTFLACVSDPYMAAVRAWMVDVFVKHGESPALAPATAVLVSSAVLCAAPAVFRWVVRKLLK
ncbi:hypothetical protein WDV93_21640 [Pantoea ananatis]